MPMRTSAAVTVLGLACLAVGILLSLRVEPDVRVERVSLGRGIPALRFLPLGPGPHPTALLAHGVTASKETLFRLGEALAHAGYDSFAIDLPGHGEAFTSRVDRVSTLAEAAEAIGGVRVFVGHSMGAYAGAACVRRGRLDPALFVSVGATPDLGKSIELELLGRFDEVIAADALPPAGDARRIVSQWSDHVLEPYDPNLVDAAVEAACALDNQAPPASPTAWMWRLAGLLIGVAGALMVGSAGTRLWAPLAYVRGPLIAFLAVGTIAVGAGSWLGAAPVPSRIPLQVAAIAVAGLAAWMARRLHASRWVFGGLALLGALGCVTVGARLLALLFGLSALPLFAGAALGTLAQHEGTPVQGDLAFAILVGYALGQWLPVSA